jgi:hypothetical protein
MNIRVRKVLENWITDAGTVDKVAHKIAMTTPRYAYEDIMDHIRYFQFKGT